VEIGITESQISRWFIADQKSTLKKNRNSLLKRMVEVSVTTNKDGMTGNRNKKIELKKVKQQH
jgi:hypothetical protein